MTNKVQSSFFMKMVNFVFSGGPTTDGYNSEDEYSHYGVQLSEEEWQEKDRRFERLMKVIS